MYVPGLADMRKGRMIGRPSQELHLEGQRRFRPSHLGRLAEWIMGMLRRAPLMRLGYPVGAHMILEKQFHRIRFVPIPERNKVGAIKDLRLRFGIHKTSTAKAKENVERRHTFSRFMAQIGSACI